MQALIEWILNLGEHYPDCMILVVGSLFGYAMTIAAERYFLPNAVDADVKRTQQGFTFILCWAASATASASLWYALDPADPLRVRLTVSIVVGALGFFIYPPLARLLSDKFPAIGSAWDGGKKP